MELKLNSEKMANKRLEIEEAVQRIGNNLIRTVENSKVNPDKKTYSDYNGLIVSTELGVFPLVYQSYALQDAQTPQNTFESAFGFKKNFIPYKSICFDMIIPKTQGYIHSELTPEEAMNMLLSSYQENLPAGIYDNMGDGRVIREIPGEAILREEYIWRTLTNARKANRSSKKGYILDTPHPRFGYRVGESNSRAYPYGISIAPAEYGEYGENLSEQDCMEMAYSALENYILDIKATENRNFISLEWR